MEREELVSIGVITYNSCNTVIETLESIKAQTYPNIELIISDDCSQDNTIDICREWLKINKKRFNSVELLTIDNNTGTASNCNRFLKACHGTFIKSVAGDDLLEPNCIYIDMANIGNAEFVFTDMICFNGCQNNVTKNNKYLYVLSSISKEKRKKLFCRTLSSPNTPSWFSRKSLYEKVGFYEENSGTIEDVSFFLKVLSSDSRIVYIPHSTVWYRDGGISHNFDKIFVFQTKLLQVFDGYCKKELSWLNPIDAYALIDYKIWSVIVKNKNKFLLRLYLSRYNFIHKFKKTLSLLFINF